jgi:hypothetical protein
MAKTIAIKNWSHLYENSETKKYKQLKWLPLPNKHDGEGWGRLWELPDATEIFGAFILMLEIASKCPERGVIHKDGEPITPQGMAYKTKAPVNIFIKAIQPLIDIGWLEIIDRPGKSAEIYGRTTGELNRIEQNRTIDISNDNTQDSPSAPSLTDLIPLNFKEIDHKNALSLVKVAPGLAKFDLSKDGYSESCLDIVRGMLDLHEKYHDENLLKPLNHFLKDAASPLLICAAVRRLNAMKSKPENWYAYWKSIMGNPEALRKEWEQHIWPQLKNGTVKYNKPQVVEG